MNDDLCILDGGYPLIGAKKRGGKFVTKVTPDVTMKNIRGVVLDTIKQGATVPTDELHS